MKLTPLDIHQKEFRHALRGYNEDEVDQFLDKVADEFERLFKENIDLNERIEALQQKVNDFELQRQTINNTLLNAQRSADEIVVRAEAEASNIVGHANTRAKELVNDALAKKQQVRGELLRIKQAEESFRERYKALLEQNLRAITEISITDDVNELLAEVEEPKTAPEPEAQPRFAQPAPQAQSSAPVAPFSRPEPEVELEPQEPEAVVFQPEERPNTMAQSTQQMPVVPMTIPSAQPPASGFVQAVNLGELESPEIPADVELVEPSEFSMPGFASMGEREDDLDIEEID